MVKGTIITPDARAMIGRESGLVSEDVARGAIHKFARAVFDQNPLHADDAYAAKGPYGDIIAPPAFFLTLAKQTNPGGPSLRPPLPLPHGVAGGDDWELYLPIQPGDLISRRTRLADLQEKEGRFGPMVFLFFEHAYTNQRGNLVVKARSTSIAYDSGSRTESKAMGKQVSTVPGALGDGEDQVPPLTRTMGMLEIVRFCTMTEQLGLRHIDKDYARGIGLPDVDISGPFKAAMMCTMLGNWCGDKGWVHRLWCQYRGMDFCGDTLTARARVIRRYTETSRPMAECEVWVANQRGEVGTRGQAVVFLG